MSTKEIKYTDRAQAQWAACEKEVHSVMTEAECSERMINDVLANIKSAYLKAAQIDSLNQSPLTGGESAKHVNDWLTRLTGGLMLQLFYKEVELYSYKNAKP